MSSALSLTQRRCESKDSEEAANLNRQGDWNESTWCDLRLKLMRWWCLLQSSREVFITGDGAHTSFERRPHLAHFLSTVSALFEVAVFTAGSQVRIC